MVEEIKDIEVTDVIAESVNDVPEKNKEKKNKKEKSLKTQSAEEPLKLFKNCSLSLKRLSLVFFIISLFIIGMLAFAGIILIGVYLGTNMITLLLIPIISVVVILIIFARLLSGLVYGFAEIVEKYEKED